MSSSPFLLNASIDNSLKQFSNFMPDLVNLQHQSIYVDDTVAGAANVNIAMKLYEESTILLSSAVVGVATVSISPTTTRVMTTLFPHKPMFLSCSAVFLSHPKSHVTL